jgi:hypothetical protein
MTPLEQALTYAAAEPQMPVVSTAEALDDDDWLDAHPKRRFRARRGPDGYWLIRKRGDVFLRAYTRNTVPVIDTDPEIATLWFGAAWPELSFAKANRKSRQAGVRRAGGRR